jgi:uncharacterized protein YegL
MSVFESVPTYTNRAERLPCVLVLDASSSMSDAPISELNSALRVFERILKEDEHAKKRVRVLVIAVSDTATKIVDWTDAENFSAPSLTARGTTALGEGARLAIEEARSELRRLKDAGIARKVPWIWLFTDGEPNAGWEGAADELSAAHKAGEVLVYPIAVGAGANTEKLGRFERDKHVYQCDPASFQKLFEFISASAKAGSAKKETTVTPLFDQIAAS